MRHVRRSGRRFPRRALAVLLLAAAPAASAAQQASDPSGHWKGAIELPTAKLDFDVDLARSGDAWSGDISIPLQNARNLALANIVVQGDEVAFEIPNVPGSPTFKGKLGPDGKLAGTLSQGGQSFPFTLARGSDAEQATADALKGFDEWAEKAMKDWLVPGMAVAIVRDGKVVYAKGFGHRDVANQLPVTPKTLFAIGSATKAFTTFAMGRLSDEGKLRWDEPAIRYLPGLRLNDEYATAHLSPRDMVTHRSGLPRHDLFWYNNPDFTGDLLMQRFSSFEPNKELRQTWQYNNLMFVLAGHMVGRITGKSWEDAIREWVFQPLGMMASNFSVQESQKSDDHALPYGERADTLRKLNFRDISRVGPAGSINSNLEDMSKWVMAHLNGGKVGEQQILNKSTLDDMHAPQMVIPGMPQEPELSPVAYGLGWFIDNYRGHYRVHHGGNIDGFSALVSMFPRDNLGFVVLTNKNGTPLTEFTVRTLADRIFEEKSKDWSGEALGRVKASRAVAREGQKRVEAERTRDTKPAHALAAYAGEYEHPGYGVVRIGQAGKGLTMSFNNIEAPLQHWHYDVFSALENPADNVFEGTKLLFTGNVDGLVDGVQVTVEPNLPPASFKRRADRELFDPAYLQRFVGTYQLATQRGTVALQGSTLTVTIPGQPTFELEPGRNNTFALKGLTGFRVSFTMDKSGTVTELVFRQPNGTFPAKRIE